MKRMNDEIEKILSTKLGIGLFTSQGTDIAGASCVHSFAFATGMAAISAQAKYRRHFEEQFPSRFLSLHPYYIRGLCELAVRYDRKLDSIFLLSNTHRREVKNGN